MMDYESGEPMKDGNGNTITSSVTFTSSAPNGNIDIVFEIDASQLGGVQTVVFEDFYWNNINIANHAAHRKRPVRHAAHRANRARAT